jgi:hypothetical protein
MLHLRLDSYVNHNRIIAMYFFLSLSFLVAGLGLSLFAIKYSFIGWGAGTWVYHPYTDLGSRLFGFGIFLVVATFYQSLARQRKEEPLKGNTFGVIE